MRSTSAPDAQVVPAEKREHIVLCSSRSSGLIASLAARQQDVEQRDFDRDDPDRLGCRDRHRLFITPVRLAMASTPEQR